MCNNSHSNNLLIVGDGGQGKMVLDSVLAAGKHDKISFLVTCENPAPINGFSYILEGSIPYDVLLDEYSELIVALGDNTLRLSKSEFFAAKGFRLATIIHPSAVISPFATIGPGSVVFANAVINPFATIKNACIINTGAIVEHDCIIEDGVHLSPNVAMGGCVHIGKSTWICIGASISNATIIGENVTVAAGAVVLENIADNLLVAGVPAIVKKQKK